MAQRLTTLATTVLVVLVLVLQHSASGAPGTTRTKRSDTSAQLQLDAADLNPILSEDATGDGLDREKRKLPEAAFATKNAVLGLVFGASQRMGSASGTAIGYPRVTIQTTTEELPEFDRAKVSLQIPDALYGNSVNQVTTVSRIFGDLILSTARRYSEFVQLFKPLLGKALTIKGVPIGTTKPPPTSANNNSNNNNSERSAKANQLPIPDKA